jgi:hypothetical protein
MGQWFPVAGQQSGRVGVQSDVARPQSLFARQHGNDTGLPEKVVRPQGNVVGKWLRFWCDIVVGAGGMVLVKCHRDCSAGLWFLRTATCSGGL